MENSERLCRQARPGQADPAPPVYQLLTQNRSATGESCDIVDLSYICTFVLIKLFLC